MRVETRREPTFDAITGDSAFAVLIDVFSKFKFARACTTRLITRFHTADELTIGRMGFDGRMYVDVFAGQQKSKEALEAAYRAVDALGDLYRRHDPKHVRGAVLEGLCEAQLRIRYRGKLLDNNVFFTLSNGVEYESSTSIDVLGWDSPIGECHDCKVNPRRFEATWIAELQSHVLPRGFLLGLVTAYSYRVTLAALEASGISTDTRTTIISLERLRDFAPLQRK
jgi:hypothetical protein